MEKLIETIREFAEQAKVPAQVAAEKVVAVHGYQCAGDIIAGALIVLFLVACTSAAVFVLTRGMKRNVDGLIMGGSISVTVFAVVLVLIVIASLTELPGKIACIYDPAGHLMKTFLVK